MQNYLDDVNAALKLIKSDGYAYPKANEVLKYYSWSSSESSDFLSVLTTELVDTGVITQNGLDGPLYSYSNVRSSFESTISYIDSQLNIKFEIANRQDVVDPLGRQNIFLSVVVVDRDNGRDNPFTRGLPESKNQFIAFDKDGLAFSSNYFKEFYSLHELMHAFGLAHPHDGAGTGFGDALKNTKYNDQKYTVMSYQGHDSFNTRTVDGTPGIYLDVVPTTFMLLDYLALEQKGLLSDYNPQDVYDFKTSKVLETVYDTGGINSFDFDNQNKGVIADLRQGHFSSVGSSQAVPGDVAIENLAIAYGTVIKNVTGSDEADVLIGNVEDNIMHGGDEDDYIYGDGLSYDATKWVGWETHQQSYAATVGPGYYENTGLENESGNDQLFGDDGNDHLFGGAGNDLLDGGKHDDTLNGGEGHDTLKGGAGTDTYVFDTKFGKDQIIDSDGKGTIQIDGVLLNNFKLVEGTDIIYRDSVDNPKFEIIKINNGTTTDLLITALGSSGGQILVKDWKSDPDKNLGINLSDVVEETSFNREPINGDGNNNALSLYNLRTLENPNRDITAVEATHIKGEGGNDIIMGMADSRDKIEGGDDNDIISGGFTSDSSFNQLRNGLGQIEKDNISGGAGADFIFSSVNGSVVHGDDPALPNENRAGVSYNDVLIGNAYATFQINPQSAYGGQSAHAALTRDQIYADLMSHMNFSFAIDDKGTVDDASDDSVNLNMTYTKNFTNQFQEFTGAGSGANFIAKRIQNENTSDNGVLQFTTSGRYELTYDFTRNNGLAPASSSNPMPVDFFVTQYQLSSPADAEAVASLKGVNFYGDQGRDFLWGSLFADYLSGGNDSDFIYANYGHDILDGGSGDDYLNGEGGDDILLGGQGKDRLWGGSGNDQLFGGDDDDNLNGEDGDDYLVGGAGKDSFRGGIGNDIIVMSKEDGPAYGEGGNDLFIINDVAYTESQVNQNNSNPNVSPYLVGTQNGQSVYSITINDLQGSDTLALVGGNTASIQAHAQDNDVILKVGDTEIYVVNALQGGLEQIVSGESADAIAQNQFTQQININDFLVDAISNSVTITAQNANTEIVGGRVNDTLTANSGGSLLRGGKGDDQLKGEIGNDTYLYSLNDGNDTITEKGGNNSIKFAAAITAGMIDVKRVNDQLQLHISNGQIIRVNNMFDVNGAIVQANAIQQIQFADGTVWDQTKLLQEIIKPRNFVGTDYDETLIGAEGNDTLTGKKGNDQLQGGLGDDTYQFSATDGKDVIVDSQGNDRILFDNTVDENSIIVRRDTQNNLLINIDTNNSITFQNAINANGTLNSNAIESIQFANGSVWDVARIQTEIANNHSLTQNGTAINDTLQGDNASTTFIGNQGNDKLNGGAGNDIYRYALGDGSDVIQDVNGVDKLVFTNINDPSSVLVERDGDNLKFTPVDGSVITINNYFAPKAANVVDANITAVIEQLQNRWLAQAEKLIETHYGLTTTGQLHLEFVSNVDSPEAAHIELEYISGGQNASKITLEIDLTDFANAVNNANGNGPLYFDRIIAHEMVHALMGAQMDMTQLPPWFKEGTAEFIHGADERVKADMPMLNAGQNFVNLFHNATIVNPSMSAGYSVSYIAVKLLDKEIRNNGGSGIKDLFNQLKTGKTLDQSLAAVSAIYPGLQSLWTNLISFENHFKAVGFSQYQSLLNLTDTDTGSIAGSDYGNAALNAESIVPDINLGSPTGLQLTIPENYIESPEINGTIETIEFANGVVWDQSQVSIEIQNTIDRILNRSFTGTSVSDVITATEGNNQITGLAGDDQLNGLAGNDIYIYNLGDGNDTIVDTAGVDEIRFGAGINAEDIRVQKFQTNHLQLLLLDGSVITIQNAFDVAGNFTANAIENIQFSNGVNWSQSDVLLQIQNYLNRPFNGTTLADVITATEGNNVITGLAGDDQLNGLAGNDSYIYNLGDGNDTIVDTAGVDEIRFGAGINAEDIRVQKFQTNHLQLLLLDGSVITIQNAFDVAGNFTANAIENIQFSNGVNWSQSDVLLQIQNYLNRPFNGTTLADVITATEGNNVITGLTGDDQLNGGAGNDVYVYNLGDGNDTIVDAAGVDEIRFGAGINSNEILVQQSALVDLQLLLKDNSSIVIKNVFDSLGNFTSNSIETINFSDNTSWTQSDILVQIQNTLNRPFTGTAVDDVISATNGNNMITGLAGNDQLNGGAGNDVYVYNLGDGNDTIVDTVGVDEIRFGAGINAEDIRVQKFQTNHLQLLLLDGSVITIQNAFDSAGNFTNNAIENIQFSNGVNWSQSDVLLQIQNYLNRPFNGTTIADVITATEGNNVITGLTGNDQLHGGAGNDVYVYNLGDGNDTIVDTSGVDEIRFGASINANDVRVQRFQTNHLQILLLDGSAITVQNAFDTVGNFTANAIENIQFSNGVIWSQSDVLSQIQNYQSHTFNGTNGADVINATSGDDLVTGFAGNDQLNGGAGNDVYIYNLGDGNDTIVDTSGVDEIRFGTGVDANDVRVQKYQANHLQFLLIDGSVITVQNAFDAAGNFTNNAIENIQFSTGFSWTQTEILVQIQNSLNRPFTGTSGVDVINATDGNNIITGLAGSDQLNGGAGNDVYVYNLGDGNDTIFDAAGTDEIRFGVGINANEIQVVRNSLDLIIKLKDGSYILVKSAFDANGNFDENMIEKINFSSGESWNSEVILSRSKIQINGTKNDDRLIGSSADEYIRGSAGWDVIEGRGGHDILDGGAGNDLLYGGWGSTTYIFSVGSGNDSIINEDYGRGGMDTVRFLESIRPEEVLFSRSGNDLDIGIKGRRDSLRIRSYFSDETRLGYGVNTLRFHDGTVLSVEDVKEKVLMGSSFDDTIVGFNSADMLRGFAGKDWLTGNAGNDALSGDEGDDRLFGSDGDDFLEGGSGNDTLNGNIGSDTYFFDIGFGKDVIETSEFDFIGEDLDIIQFGEGINLNDLYFTRTSYSSLLISDINGTNTISVARYFDGPDYKLNFLNGEELTIDDVKLRMFNPTNRADFIVGYNGVDDTINGGAGHDEIYGDEISGAPGNDVLNGGSGNDVLRGEKGDDTLSGGTGNDRLFGGIGSDIYQFDVNSGQDTIYFDENDILKFGTGILSSQINIFNTNKGIVLKVNDQGDSVVLVRDPNQNATSMSSIQFSDGTSWNSETIRNFIQTAPFERGTNVYGTANSDTLSGSLGDDSLDGGSGNDILNGGFGNDILQGSTGNDIYIFEKRSGHDVINNYDNAANKTDTIQFAEGILPSDISIRRDGNNLVLTIGDSLAGITVTEYFYNNATSGNKIEKITFASGVVWDVNYIKAAVLVSTENNDVIFGYAAAETFYAGLGDDYISAGSGNDVLDGGAGADILDGGLGSDIFHFGRGYGADSIQGSWDQTGTKSDVLQLGEGIVLEDLSFEYFEHAASRGLTISVKDTQDKISIYNYFYYDGQSNPFLDLVKFFDGSSLTFDQLLSIYNIGTNANDTLLNFGNNPIMGLGGDDTLSSIDGSLFGGDGDDKLFSSGNSVLDGGAGRDSLRNSYAPHEINNNIHIGGAGDDDIEDSGGHDTYRFNLGDGSDWIRDFTGIDVLEFGEGITAENIEITNGPSGVEIFFKDSPYDKIVFAEWNLENRSSYLDGKIELIKFSDGTSISFDDRPLLDTTVPWIYLELGNSTVFQVGGRAEQSSLVYINDSNGNQVAVGNTDTVDGYINISLDSKYFTGEELFLYVRDVAGNTTPAQVIKTPDKKSPDIPLAAFDSTGKIISGIAEVGSTVIIKNSAGSQIGITTADTITGNFTVTLATALINKQTVNITAKDTAGNISPTKAIIAPDLTPPGQPTGSFNTAGSIISGVAEAGSTLIVKNSSGIEIGNSISDTAGNYTVILSVALINKETISVVARDEAGNISTAKTIIAPDLTPPDQPTASFNTAGKIISGVAEKSSTVIVKNAAGIQIGTATANASTGAYSITLGTALINQELVNVSARDSAGNVSIVKSINAPDKTAPIVPTAIFDITTGKTITGVAEIGSTVIVKNSSGTQIGTTTADVTSGVYTVTLATALINKETVNVTASDAAGNVSTAKSVIAPDLTPPGQPTASFNTAGTIISGTAEKSSTVIVKNAGGIQIGTATANASTGAYSITLGTPLINKELVSVNAQDAAGNLSVVRSISAPDKTPPAAPTASINTTGKIVTGIAEIGSTVVINNASNTQIGTATANATTGAYTITLATAISVGQTVKVTAKDAAGNTSAITNLTRSATSARVPAVDNRVEALIQAMASFAPPSGVETNVISGFDDRSNLVIAVGQ